MSSRLTSGNGLPVTVVAGSGDDGGMSSAAARAGRFPDFLPAPNQGGRPSLYELENRAMDPDGLVLAAMRRLAPWRGRVLVDLGCGSGYWLPGYAAEAASVIGIEPDPRLLPHAARRHPRARVLPGSAEHLPLADASVDVVHARFAYFWPPACERGLAEVLRVLKPGGTLVVVDNDHRHGEFAALLREAPNTAQGDPRVTDAWWARRGAERVEVTSRWQFASRSDFEAVLRLEFPERVAGPWLGRHPRALGLTYGYVLFAVRRPGGGTFGGRLPANALCLPPFPGSKPEVTGNAGFRRRSPAGQGSIQGGTRR